MQFYKYFYYNYFANYFTFFYIVVLNVNNFYIAYDSFDIWINVRDININEKFDIYIYFLRNIFDRICCMICFDIFCFYMLLHYNEYDK